MREKTTDIPQQDALTKDGVRVRVNGVVYFSVKDPKPAILYTEDYDSATIEMASTFSMLADTVIGTTAPFSAISGAFSLIESDALC